MKYFISAILVLVLAAAGVYWYTQSSAPPATESPSATEQEEQQPATTTEAAPSAPTAAQEVIGTSIEDRDIVAYHFGTGGKELLFVGGIHGGYEWNTVLVARELVKYLKANPSAIPSGVKVTVIPTLNPDGLAKVVSDPDDFAAPDVSASPAKQVEGRFNANNVDLNRNFDCDWKASGIWQSKTVSGGDKAFSEPESRAFREYVESHSIAAAVVWYSSAGGVFASTCHNGILPETSELTTLFAKASGYKAYESFDFYAITGDAVNWLAKQKIPAISVLLTTHTDIEWDRNLKGVLAVLQHYAD